MRLENLDIYASAHYFVVVSGNREYIANIHMRLQILQRYQFERVHLQFLRRLLRVS